MSNVDEKIRELQRRANIASMRGADGPYPEEWEKLQEKAAAVVRETYPSFNFSSEPAVPTGKPFRPTLCPAECIPVNAATVLGLERRLADLEAQYLAAMRSWEACRDDMMLMRNGHHPLEDAILDALEHCCELSDNPIINYTAKINIKAKIEDYYGRTISRAPRTT